MFKTLTFIFGFLTILIPVIIELLRAIVHKKRSRSGIAQTQDIAMFGTFFGLVIIIGFIASGIGWWLTS